MILVGQYDSPYVRRVAVSMMLLDLPFTRNTISGFGDAEEMRKINPLGRIPSLILDDGEVIIDSWAILDYLDGVAGVGRSLLPPPGRLRRRGMFVVALAAGVVDKMGAKVYEMTLRPAEKRHQPWLERCSTQVASGLAALEAETGDGWYLGGDRVMQPDITVGCMLWYLRDRFPEEMEAVPRLAAFGERFGRVPAYQATEPSPEESMPARPL